MTASEPSATDLAAAPAAVAFAVPEGTTPEQVAAVTVLLLAAGGTAAVPPTPRSAWGDPRRRLRAPVQPGPGGWRAGAMPR